MHEGFDTVTESFVTVLDLNQGFESGTDHTLLVLFFDEFGFFLFNQLGICFNGLFQMLELFLNQVQLLSETERFFFCTVPFFPCILMKHSV